MQPCMTPLIDIDNQGADKWCATLRNTLRPFGIDNGTPRLNFVRLKKSVRELNFLPPKYIIVE